MNKTWIRTLTFALLMTGCSSSSESDPPGDKGGEPGAEKEDSGRPRDATAPNEDSDTEVEESKVDEPEPRDAGRTVDAGKDEAQDAAPPKNDVDASDDQAWDPRCGKDASSNGPGVFMPDPNIVGDDWFGKNDGVVFTTAGVIYRLPGKGLVFGRQEADSCVVTVAESGVMTTVYGEGTVCHAGRVVSLGIKCQTDANGDPVTP
ncbi:MAG TPA: hypothetical protein VFX59_11710 [Polyangiales bacterium]|nr:hypothetical protein [Polyangiales bacterium]